MNELNHQPVSGQMCWLRSFGKHALVLHVRLDSSKPWQVYSTSPFSVPDYPIPNGSKGWATYQALRQAGWCLVLTQEASKQADYMIADNSLDGDITSLFKAA